MPSLSCVEPNAHAHIRTRCVHYQASNFSWAILCGIIKANIYGWKFEMRQMECQLRYMSPVESFMERQSTIFQEK